MSGKKKKFGRGFEDLYAQNESDLPFLDAYGEAAEDHGEGLPDSTQGSQPEEILAALQRHLKAAGCEFESVESGLNITNKLEVMLVNDTLRLSINSESNPLPLVPSDLMAPGFSGGSLSDNRQECELVVLSWSNSLRRLLDRMIEYWTLV